jgi:NitT/TauT family transport system ATP-binding protein
MVKTPLIEVKDVRHYFNKGSGGEFVVLDNINLTLYEDEIVCLLGRSGAGKSTLLRIISGLIEPSEGTITIQGEPATSKVDDISMVFQHFALFPWLTVLQNVELGLEAQKLNRDELQARALKAIDLIGLDGYEQSYPRELSGGMQQRVGLARALVVKPLVLLMDEPFSALDVLTEEILRADLLDLWIEGQLNIKSILSVTHNIEEALLMADRILIFGSNPGRIISELSINMVQPRNRLAPDFRALVDHIYSIMTTKDENYVQKTGIFPGTGIGMVLPTISTNVLQGFMETLQSVYNGKADLPALSETLGNTDMEIIKIAEVLQLLRLCELTNGDVTVTVKGKTFAEGDIDERKKMFREHLLAYIPLATHIKNVLDDRVDHTAPESRFLDELEDFMPTENANMTLKTIIGWGRYAELFAFNDQTGRLYLEL